MSVNSSGGTGGTGGCKVVALLGRSGQREFALDEGTEKSLGDLRDSVKQIVRMGKEAIVAVIERRGEVIYYRVTKATFRK